MKALRVAVLVAAALMTAMFVYVVGARIGFPYELEWMCGSVLDHVDRVRAGLPVYTAPTTRWIPYLYPPLFYWMAAPLGATFLSCRLVSLAATAVQAACVWRLARRGDATPYWSALGVLLFFSAYFYVGYWYDIERSDTLCVAMVLASAVVLVDAKTVARSALGGALLGVAFFAKQQAVPFAAAAALALLVDRQAKRAIALTVACAVIVMGGARWQDALTDGWFSYYVVKMPAVHGIDPRLWHAVLRYDVQRGAGLLVFTVGLCAVLLRDAWRGDRRHVVFALMLGTGGVVALSSRLHVGGWINVLQPWTSFACPAIAIAGARLERWVAGSQPRIPWLAATYALILAQLASWMHPLDKWIPDRTLRADTGTFLMDVRRLERDGEVLVVGRGHVTERAHFQMSALADVARVGGAPADLMDALRTRRLAAIVDDARSPGDKASALWPPVMIEDVAHAREALFANYYVAERLADPELRMTMAAPAMPRWVYRPRRSPLAESDGDLERRHFAEIVLADRAAPATP
jgi:hypothetical protein